MEMEQNSNITANTGANVRRVIPSKLSLDKQGRDIRIHINNVEEILKKQSSNSGSQKKTREEKALSKSK